MLPGRMALTRACSVEYLARVASFQIAICEGNESPVVLA